MDYQEPRFFYLRIFLYLTLTSINFIISYSPVVLTFSWIFIDDFSLNILTVQFWVVLFSPVILFLVYLSGWAVFVLIHSKIICPFFLVPIKPGHYPLSKNITKLLAIRVSADQTTRMMLTPLDFMPLIVNRYLRPFFLRCYGVKVGKNVYFSRDNKVDASPLIEIGDNIIVGQLSVISCHFIAKQELVLDKVFIGHNVTIGDYAIILPGAILQNNIVIGPKAIVPKKHLEDGITFYHQPAIEMASTHELY